MNLTLIGMPGVGKSSVGKLLAKRLGYSLIDTDIAITEALQTPLQTLISTYGNDYFMEQEEKAILSLGTCQKSIIAPGGSAVYSEKGMLFLKKISTVIYLRDSLNNIQKRLHNLHTRGIVGLKEKGLPLLFQERCFLYERYADIIVDVNPHFQCKIMCDTILNALKGVSIEHP